MGAQDPVSIPLDDFYVILGAAAPAPPSAGNTFLLLPKFLLRKVYPILKTDVTHPM